MRSIKIASTNSISVQKISTKSSFTVTLPRDFQLSNIPMAGFFQIRCALDSNGTNWNTTVSMNTTVIGPNGVRDNIIQACTNYRDNIEVWIGPQFSYLDDGRDLMIRFVGLNYDVPQMQIISASDIPITGNNV
jgi:hypothetical protein